MTSPVFNVVVVCSYNRARSVLGEFVLRRALDEAGVAAEVSGAGFNSEGAPPLAATIDTLRQLGFDPSGYLSTRITPAMVGAATLVLTAERMHVVRIAEDDPAVFHRTFTFPEFVAAAEAAGPRGDQSFTEWIAAVGAGRTHATFLAAPVPEVADPAGMSNATFGATAAQLDDLSRRLAALL